MQGRASGASGGDDGAGAAHVADLQAPQRVRQRRGAGPALHTPLFLCLSFCPFAASSRHRVKPAFNPSTPGHEVRHDVELDPSFAELDISPYRRE